MATDAMLELAQGQAAVGATWEAVERLARAAGGEGDPQRALADRGLSVWAPGDGAPLLFVRGELPARAWLRAWGVAVVGARATDGYGRALAARVGHDAVRLGGAVVSGGAEGCDAAAHEAALEARGRTIVVLGSGHDHPYPRVNRGLFERVVASGGAVVSAYWPTGRPQKHRFLERNDVIAGLSAVVVVVRASVRSGSLSTAAAARRRGRPVLAVPGDVGQGLSGGPHLLLQQGAAPMVGRRSLARALGVDAAGGAWPVTQAGAGPPWGGGCDDDVAEVGVEAARVLAAFAGDSALDLDALVVRTSLAVDVVTGALLDLEMAGRIHALPGDRFVVAR